MIIHYLKIAFRQLLKYKTQTAVSICAMAVSITMMSLITSMMMLIKPVAILHQPYSDRIEKLMHADTRYPLTTEDINLIIGHQFKSAEAIHFCSTNVFSLKVSADFGDSERKSLLASGIQIDPAFLDFYGAESAYSGRKIEPLAANEIVISEALAKKLFADDNPIGRTLNVHFYYFNGSEIDKNYVIKDVMEPVGTTSPFIHHKNDMFFHAEQLSSDFRFECFFLIREGYTADDLQTELDNLISGDKIETANVKRTYSDIEDVTLRNCLILFLFLFVCVSFSSYIRQQAQLFRMREREVAIRTCSGGKPCGLFLLFSCEIMVTLMATLLTAIVLNYIAEEFLLRHYSAMIDLVGWTRSEIMTTSVITVAILTAISLIVVALTVRRIRKDQTGLALRMKPRPKHRLRNVGITVQMVISILFAWLTFTMLLSADGIKEYYGIPDDADRYKKSLILRLNDVSPEETERIYSDIERIESVDKTYKFFDYMTYYSGGDFDPSSDQNTLYYIYYQNADDVIKFYDLKIDTLRRDAAPQWNIAINESFKQLLVDRGIWNGKSANIQGVDYDIVGMFDRLPFHGSDAAPAVIVTNAARPYSQIYDCIVMPKPGREAEARAALNAAIKEVVPDRIDLPVDDYFLIIATKYVAINGMLTAIYILSLISIVTTVATIYASVSLDTRRRRKEMALRKFNGANAKIIGMIFTRTYISILAAAVAITLPVVVIIMAKGIIPDETGLTATTGMAAYALALLLITAITALTIGWKIRDIMRVDPVEYLRN